MVQIKLTSAVVLLTTALWYGSEKVSCQDVRLSELPDWAWGELVVLFTHPKDFLSCVVADKVMDLAVTDKIYERLAFLEIYPLKNTSLPSVRAALVKLDDDKQLSAIILDMWEKVEAFTKCSRRIYSDSKIANTTGNPEDF